MKLSAPWLVGVFAAALLAACAGTGPKPAALTSFKATAEARIVWRASVGRSRQYVFSPAYRDGAVYAAGQDGDLVRIDAERGRVTWRRHTKEALSGGVGVTDDMVLLGTAKGSVLAYDTAGKFLWRSNVSSEILSAPAGAASAVVVRSGDGKIYGLDPKDGSRKWEYQAATPPLTLRSAPGLVIVGDNALVSGLPAGKMVVLNLANGAVLWETAVATPRGDNELERIADIAGTPLVEPERVCAVTFQGRIGCYETQRGTQLWTRPASSAAGISADSVALYYTEANGSVVALDKASGASVWKQDKLFARGVSAPLAYDKWVVIGDYKGYVHFLSREDGSFIARTATDGGAIVVQPAAAGGRVLVQTRHGGLFALQVRERK